MKVTYDPSVDALRIRFGDAPIKESDEEKPGVILDYDAEGRVVAIEILDASKHAAQPQSFEYSILH